MHLYLTYTPYDSPLLLCPLEQILDDATEVGKETTEREIGIIAEMPSPVQVVAEEANHIVTSQGDVPADHEALEEIETTDEDLVSFYMFEFSCPYESVGVWLSRSSR